MKTCEFCDEPRYDKSRYCRVHKNEIRRGQYKRKTPVPDPCHCGAKHHAKGLCRIHYLEKWRRDHGIPERPPAKPKPPRKKRKKKAAKPKPPSGGRRGRIRQEVVGYRAAHLRVEEVKGKAKDYECSVCNNPANEWSLDPLAVHTYEDDKGKVWSMNIDDYDPYCYAHHRERDGGYHWRDGIIK